MQIDKLLKLVVVVSIGLLIGGDIVFLAFPSQFLDRHAPGYVLNNAILDYATIIPGVAGTLSGLALAVRTRRWIWAVAAALVALLFAASFFMGVLFAGGRV